jgi:hypothetical protein
LFQRKSKLPEVEMQVFAADIVIDTDEAAPDECVAAFSGVHVDIAPSIFKRPVADRFVRWYRCSRLSIPTHYAERKAIKFYYEGVES